MKTYIETLRERIEQNYEDFKSDTVELLDGDLIFCMARKIASVQDVYELSKTSGWIEEAEAAYLLEFADPLKMLADAWEDFLFDTESEFRMVVEDVLDADDNNNNYITAAYAAELKQKYGDDVSVMEALLMEVLETGKKLTLLNNMLDDEGVDFCFDKA